MNVAGVPHFDIDLLTRALGSLDRPYAKSTVELLLGSDREIGREQKQLERRVGLVPQQIDVLRHALLALRLEPRIMVLNGAGERAGHSNHDFVRAGAEIIAEHELPDLDGPPDVVHALKEPSSYEQHIPGPFCRIGAMHGGGIDATSGLAALIDTGNAAAIFDGSHTGSPRANPPRVPIRRSQSVITGEITARWIIDKLTRSGSGNVVVVGYGEVGRSAVETLLPAEVVAKVYAFDTPARVASITPSTDPRFVLQATERLDDVRLLQALDGSAALLLAAARPGSEAPRVVRADTVTKRMREHALIIDVSIDERGAIADAAITSSWTQSVIAKRLKEQFEAGGREYLGISNVNRTLPTRSSLDHGNAVLPYILLLLYLSAVHKGANGVADEIAGIQADFTALDPSSFTGERLVAAVMQDLRNGLAFRSTGRILEIYDIVADRRNLFDFLNHTQRPFRFGLTPSIAESIAASEVDLTGNAEAMPEYVRRAMAGEVFDLIEGSRPVARLGPLPKPNRLDDDLVSFSGGVRTCLRFAADYGIPCTVVVHPDIDGTRTDKAIEALEVTADRVLKCLVFRGDSGRYVAGICTGNRRVSEQALGDVSGEVGLRLATEEEVVELTGYHVGGIPFIEIARWVAAAYVDDGVYRHETVFGSAGSEYAGLEIRPADLEKLGFKRAPISKAKRP